MIFATARAALRAERHLRLARQRRAQSDRLPADAAARHRDDLRRRPGRRTTGAGTWPRSRWPWRFYAGFPEVAYFNGLFCAAWAIGALFSLPRFVAQGARAPRPGRRRRILLSLPILVPFADFLKVGQRRHHNRRSRPSRASDPRDPMFFDPYVYGDALHEPNVGEHVGRDRRLLHGSVGALALLGTLRSSQRPLRIFLAVWTVVGVLGRLQLLQVRLVWNLIPLLKNVGLRPLHHAELRTVADPARGLRHHGLGHRASGPKRLFTVTTSVMLLVLVWIVLRPARSTAASSTHRARYIILIGLDAAALHRHRRLLVLGRLTKHKVVPAAGGAVLVGESVLMFFVPDGRVAQADHRRPGPDHVPAQAPASLPLPRLRRALPQLGLAVRAQRTERGRPALPRSSPS
jgi:hypothetical protein